MGYQNSLYGSIAACGKIIVSGTEIVTAAIEGKPFNIRSVERIAIGNYVVNIGTLDGSDGVDILNRVPHVTVIHAASPSAILKVAEDSADPFTSDTKVHVLAFSLFNGEFVLTDTSFSISVERASQGNV